MDELKKKEVIQGLLEKIRVKTAALPTPIKLMEVCGTHTMALHRYGLKKMLLDVGIDMLTGPGCPVCITPNEFHEAAIRLVTGQKDFVLTTFGDMTRVPTALGSLQTVIPAVDSRVKVVYSPAEALDIARKSPEKDVVFFGVGFETTIPAVALTAKAAAAEELPNFSVLTAFWLVPPPLKALLQAEDVRVQGFLYPGHVSAIIGEEPYRFIAEDFGVPGAIAGFEPGDILLAIDAILDQMAAGRPAVANEYARVVRSEGNPAALAVMRDMLEVTDSHWRGLGVIPRSGLRLRPEYRAYDAEIKYDLSIEPGSGDLPGCRCGEVLQGKLSPPECPLYGTTCRPDSPYGPCMVSYEGACLAHYKYSR
ncbi:MAG: hydrogenase formation protein HypD [Candidatus Aminicenantaceae bacterium]